MMIVHELGSYIDPSHFLEDKGPSSYAFAKAPIIWTQTSGNIDPFCSFCRNFSRKCLIATELRKCCDSAFYCVETDCQARQWAECHWLFCTNTPSKHLKKFNNYKSSLGEKLIIDIASGLVATVFGSSIKQGLSSESSFADVLLDNFAVILRPFSDKIDSHKIDVHEVIEESFAFLSSLLCNERIPLLFQHYSNNNPNQCQSISLGAMLTTTMNIFDVSLWAKLIMVADVCSIPLYLPSPILQKIQELPSLLDYAEKIAYIKCFSKELQSSSIFFTGKVMDITDMSNNRPSIEEQLQVERAVFILSQAASLQLSSSSLSLDNAADIDHPGIINPFSCYGATVHVLIPGFFPHHSSSVTSISHRKVLQSCCPNLNLVPIYSKNDCLWAYKFKVVRDIMEKEEFSFDFTKGNDSAEGGGKQLGMFRHLYFSVDRKCQTLCRCLECSYYANEQLFIEERLTHNYDCMWSTKRDSLRSLYSSLHMQHEKLVAFEKTTNSSLLETVFTYSSVFQGLRDLVVVADNLAANHQYYESTKLYALTLDCVLKHMVDLEEGISIFDGSIMEQSKLKWIVKLCLSLGTSCFEYMLLNSSMVDPITIDIMTLAYEMGHSLDPFSHQLKDIVEKFSMYKNIDETNSYERHGMECVAIMNDVYLTTKAEISAERCDWIISQAETYALESGKNWTTSRHYAVPTTDIPIHAIPAVAGWFTSFIHHEARQLLSSCFFSNEDIEIVINDAFIVKYDGDCDNNHAKQRSLPLHMDQSTHSFTIALNSIAEYVGGGTYLPAVGQAIRPDKGHLLCFTGSTLHGGDTVLKGKRYIIAAFLAVLPRLADKKRNLQQEEEGNCLKKAKGSDDTEDKGFSFNFSFSS